MQTTQKIFIFKIIDSLVKYTWMWVRLPRYDCKQSVLIHFINYFPLRLLGL